MNLNKLREHVQKFLDQLVIQWITSLIICLDEAHTYLRRKWERGKYPSGVEKPYDEGNRKGSMQEGGTFSKSALENGGQLTMSHPLDPLMITCVRFSPDGRRLAYSGSDGTVTILDLESGRPLCIFREHRDWITSVDWDPAGKRLASSSSDGLVYVWSDESGQPLFPPISHITEVRAVAWSPDGARLAATIGAKIVIWPIRELREGLVVCAGHSGQVHTLAWSPCGTQLASASKDWSVRIWDTGSGKMLQSFWHDGPVNTVVWSPDPMSGLIASGSDDRLVRIWNTHTGTCDFTYTGHRDYAGISSCAWPQPGRIISADWNFTIQEWTKPSKNARSAVSIVVPRPQFPLLDTDYIRTLAAHTTTAGTLMALGGHGWMMIGSSPAEPGTMLGDSSGGRVIVRP